MNFYILPDNQGYYDPQGVYFDADGFNADGGYYDEAGRYWPPRSQRKRVAKDIDDDELIKQFEDGLNETDDLHDDFQNKYYRQYEEEVVPQEEAVPVESEEEDEEEEEEGEHDEVYAAGFMDPPVFAERK